MMESIVRELQKTHDIIGRRDELTTALIAVQAGKHILFEGAVGVGKTTIALAVAAHLKRKIVRIDGDERYTEQKLAGWYDPPLVLAKGYTKEAFIHGPLSKAMLEGAILLLNELNRMPEGTQNVMLSAMDERTIHIPKYGAIDAEGRFMIIATQNPDEYIGTSQLSEALKDRFICINLGYQSEEAERKIVKLRSACRDEDIIDVSVSIARMTREEKEIRRGSSVRGAIDLSDMFWTTYDSFNDDLDKWVRCAEPALLTKIELQDFSREKFIELLKGIIEKALEMQRTGKTSSKAGRKNVKPEIDWTPDALIEKKK
ncbi:MAG TPA: MoxR family ATPase [Dehalococcoidia bacterium]|nr:MoxR family ATPase [Dehalococcoidia bacterium]